MRLLLTSQRTSSHLATGLVPLTRAPMVALGSERLVCDLEAMPVPQMLSACQSGEFRP